DGGELAERLARIANLPVGPERLSALRTCVDPYLQFATSGAVCEFTGFRLIDVWRYFRHTWTTQYNSTTGRNIFVLVRDRADENHPVVGIAALGSAVVQLRPRDKWIGWSSEEFLVQLAQHPDLAWARWVRESLSALIRSVYAADL